MKNILALSVSILAACGTTQPEKHYACTTWCGTDTNASTEVAEIATDADDAANQCFEDLGATCSNGSLRKCSCVRDQ